MKQFVYKVCMLLLAVMVTVACGNGAQKGEQSQDGAQTEAKAASKSKSKKSKKNKEIKTIWVISIYLTVH